MAINYPIVGIPCDINRSGINASHGVGEKYINAIAHGSRVCPILIPAQGPGEDLESMDENMFVGSLLNKLDGLFLAGSPSNIMPDLYGDEASLTPNDHDSQRDSMSLLLIKAAFKRKMPILAVCRGMQEVNVALGGTLHQRVQDVEGLNDHREDKHLPREEQYGDSHTVQLRATGELIKLVDTETIRVNSLHGQGIKQLAEGLVTEAHASDDLVEAFRLNDDDHFVWAVQWHPEWQFKTNIFSSALFASFGNSVRTFAQKKASKIDA